MRYFVRVDQNPQSDTYEQPQSLHRLERTSETLIVERLDKDTGQWVDNPNLISMTGIGGDEDYKEIDEGEAARIATSMGGSLNSTGTEMEEMGEQLPEAHAQETETPEAKENEQATMESQAQAGQKLLPELEKLFSKPRISPIEGKNHVRVAEVDPKAVEIVKRVLADYPLSVQHEIYKMEIRLREMKQGGTLSRRIERKPEGAELLEQKASAEEDEVEVENLTQDLEDSFDEFEMPPVGKGANLTLVSGLPASGKSTLIGDKLDDESQFVIESDEIKARMPEYRGWNAAVLSEQAATKVGQLLRRALNARKSVVWEGSFSDADLLIGIIDTFKESGFGVNFYYVDVPLETAVRRAIDRFQGPTHRYMSPFYILAMTGLTIDTFNEMRGVVDEWRRFDNTNDNAKPRIVDMGKASDRKDLIVERSELDALLKGEPIMHGPLRRIIMPDPAGNIVVKATSNARASGLMAAKRYVNGLRSRKRDFAKKYLRYLLSKGRLPAPETPRNLSMLNAQRIRHELSKLLAGGLVERGGAGSGHYGHSGRPGKVGGSLPKGATATSGHDPQARFSNIDIDMMAMPEDLGFEPGKTKTVKILLEHLGEVSYTDKSPKAVYEEGMVDLDEQVNALLSNDDWRLVKVNRWAVVEIDMPSWMNPNEYIRQFYDWDSFWRINGAINLPENIQRWLIYEPDRVAARALAKLLAKVPPRSEFKRSLRAQALKWFQTPDDERQYPKPLSSRQISALTRYER